MNRQIGENEKQQRKQGGGEMEEKGGNGSEWKNRKMGKKGGGFKGREVGNG